MKKIIKNNRAALFLLANLLTVPTYCEAMEEVNLPKDADLRTLLKNTLQDDVQPGLANSSYERDIVVFLGYTGAGKSTLINYLANIPIKVDERGCIALAGNSISGAMKIGGSSKSETFLPQFIKSEDFAFYDLPGFSDTRGIEVRLANACFIKNIIEKAKTVKFVFVAGQDEITAVRGQAFKNLLATAKNLISNQSIEDLSSLVITKSVPRNTKQGLPSASKWTKENLIEFLIGWVGPEGKVGGQVDERDLTPWVAGRKLSKMSTPYMPEISDTDKARISNIIWVSPEINLEDKSRFTSAIYGNEEIKQEDKNRLAGIISNAKGISSEDKKCILSLISKAKQINQADRRYILDAISSTTSKKINSINISAILKEGDLNRLKEVYSAEIRESVSRLTNHCNDLINHHSGGVQSLRDVLNGFCQSLKRIDSEMCNAINNLDVFLFMEKGYFREYDLHLMSELPTDRKPLQNKIYIEKKNARQLNYKVISPANQIVEEVLDIEVVEDLTPKILESLKKKILGETFKRGHTPQDLDEKTQMYNLLRGLLSPHLPEWKSPENGYNEIHLLVRNLRQLVSVSADRTGTTLQLKGLLIGTSDISDAINSHPGKTLEVDVYSLNSLFIDSDVSLPGINLTLLSPKWCVVGKRTISLKGNDGNAHDPEKADNGVYSSPGSDGLPGKPGQSGGNFYGKGADFISLNSLAINVSGGKGGPGQDGGNGGVGYNGKDGSLKLVQDAVDLVNQQDSTQRNHSLLAHRESMDWGSNESWAEWGQQAVKTFLTFNGRFRETYISGTLGTRGGDGGKGGIGGLGGKGGSVSMVVKQYPIFNVIKGDGARGSDGTAGEIGKGGKNGERYIGKYIVEIVSPGVRGVGTGETATTTALKEVATTGAVQATGAGVKLAAKDITMKAGYTVVNEVIVNEAGKVIAKEGGKAALKKAGEVTVLQVGTNAAGKAVITAAPSTLASTATSLGLSLLAQAVLSPISAYMSGGWESGDPKKINDQPQPSGKKLTSLNDVDIKESTPPTSINEKEKNELYNSYYKEMKENKFVMSLL